MSVKTITIDQASYDLLSAQKAPGESFSRLIKRRLEPQKTARALRLVLPKCVVALDTLGRLEDVVKTRAASLAVSHSFGRGK